jgi:hypothetical protein
MNEKIEYLPFNAINEFMLLEYRKLVIKSVFSRFDSLPNTRQRTINAEIKKLVKIQGFRDSSQAPIGIKSRESSTVFEKSAKFAGEILAAWAELNSDLSQNVFQMLTDRGWIILPIEADRSKLPGFLIKWPTKDSFEILTAAFRQKQSDIEYSDDDVSLMIVWLSNRLPYEMVTEDIFVKE